MLSRREKHHFRYQFKIVKNEELKANGLFLTIHPPDTTGILETQQLCFHHLWNGAKSKYRVTETFKHQETFNITKRIGCSLSATDIGLSDKSVMEILFAFRPHWM